MVVFIFPLHLEAPKYSLSLWWCFAKMESAKPGAAVHGIQSASYFNFN